MTPSLNLERLRIDKFSKNERGVGVLRSSKEEMKGEEGIIKNDSRHRHPRVCLNLTPETDAHIAKVLSYRPRDKPAVLDQSDNYKYLPKAKLVLEPRENQEKSKEINRSMVQSVIQRKEAIKLVEESHSTCNNKWNSRRQSQNNSFQQVGSARQSLDQQGKNQALTFGMVESHVYSSKPSVNLALKNSALLESRVNHLPEAFSYVATNLDSKLAEKDSSQLVFERQKAPYKNYLDSVISENDKLIEKIAKRLQVKEQAKATQHPPKASNSTYLRSSFLRPQEAKRNKANNTFDRETPKHKQTSSFHYDPNPGHVQAHRGETRNRWLESRSVEGSGAVVKQSNHGKSFELSNSIQPQVINSLQQRRALAKFLKKIK